MTILTITKIIMEEKIEENNEIALNINKNNNNQQLAGAIIIAGLFIAGAILLKGSERPVDQKDTENDLGVEKIELTQVSKNEHILGNPKASVMVVEYSDTECPFCKSFHATMHRVMERKGGEIAWVYRHYPIPELHKKAFREAEATECAWEQGGNDAFWKYTNRLFTITPSNDGLNDTDLLDIAKYTGLDIKAFNTCLDSGKFKDKVSADIESGNNAGVRGTPSSFIVKNGKVVDTIPGALPFESTLEKINAALK